LANIDKPAILDANLAGTLMECFTPVVETYAIAPTMSACMR
jgi:hypothetical protein